MRNHTILITGIIILFSAFVKTDKENEYGGSACKNLKFATAEPGTCLSSKAYGLLQALDKIEKNPYDNELSKKLMNFIEPRVFKTVDTSVSTNEVEIPIRIYYPRKHTTTSPVPIILYIHGGGFMYGSIEEYDMALKKLAKITDMIIVSLDYRLAPKHPFPAGINDSNTVLKWLSENYSAIGGLSGKIIVMGDSAGANIATVLTIMNRDEGNDIINGQVLFYPPTTFVESEFPSRLYFLRDERRSYLLTEEFVRDSKACYLPDSINERNPYASPLEADLTGNLPPTLMFTAQADPLRDEGRLYAEKLIQSGQEVRYVEYRGIIHGFFNFYMVFNESLKSMKLVRDFVNDLHYNDLQYNKV